jgi:hypothetical protein
MMMGTLIACAGHHYLSLKDWAIYTIKSEFNESKRILEAKYNITFLGIQL